MKSRKHYTVTRFMLATTFMQAQARQLMDAFALSGHLNDHHRQEKLSAPCYCQMEVLLCLQSVIDLWRVTC